MFKLHRHSREAIVAIHAHMDRVQATVDRRVAEDAAKARAEADAKAAVEAEIKAQAARGKLTEGEMWQRLRAKLPSSRTRTRPLG